MEPFYVVKLIGAPILGSFADTNWYTAPAEELVWGAMVEGLNAALYKILCYMPVWHIQNESDQKRNISYVVMLEF